MDMCPLQGKRLDGKQSGRPKGKFGGELRRG